MRLTPDQLANLLSNERGMIVPSWNLVGSLLFLTTSQGLG
jgi:hypothetical protein